MALWLSSQELYDLAMEAAEAAGLDLDSGYTPEYIAMYMGPLVTAVAIGHREGLRRMVIERPETVAPWRSEAATKPKGNAGHDDGCPKNECAIEFNLYCSGDGDVRCKGCEYDEHQCACDD